MSMRYLSRDWSGSVDGVILLGPDGASRNPAGSQGWNAETVQCERQENQPCCEKDT